MNMLALAQVVVSTTNIIQVVIVVVILGLIAGLIDRAPILDANFKMIVRWLCLILAVILLLGVLLRWAGML